MGLPEEAPREGDASFSLWDKRPWLSAALVEENIGSSACFAVPVSPEVCVYCYNCSLLSSHYPCLGNYVNAQGFIQHNKERV